MKKITLSIPEDQFSFFLKLVEALNFVQIADKQEAIADDNAYDPDFVAKIQRSKQEFEDGDYTRVKKENLKEFLGI